MGSEFCAEITYKLEDGNGWVHSDICNHNSDGISDDYRKFIHDCLDEWLNKSNGTGYLWIGDPEELKKDFTEYIKEMEME